MRLVFAAMAIVIVVATFALNSRMPIPVGLSLMAAGAIFIPGVLLGLFVRTPQGDVCHKTRTGMRASNVFLTLAPLLVGFFTVGFLSGWLPRDQVDNVAYGAVSFVVGVLATALITNRIRKLWRNAGGRDSRPSNGSTKS